MPGVGENSQRNVPVLEGMRGAPGGGAGVGVGAVGAALSPGSRWAGQAAARPLVGWHRAERPPATAER